MLGKAGLLAALCVLLIAMPVQAGSGTRHSQEHTIKQPAFKPTELSYESSAGGGERLAIIEIGASYLGTPYYSMNCSQFTSAVYAEATGVNMPADYIAQRSYGYPSPHLKRGDLLLYADGVGIYWGNNQALMSSHYWGEVTIIDMDYLYGYMGARRIRS
jgi:cell wall-associated NlpC family hydrolase